jgi:hypothetical protein
MAEGTFATAVNCMDGRVQEPVAAWIKARFGVDYVDTITEPGPDRILSELNGPESRSIRRRVEISVNKHGSRVVCLVAHHDCAGNPVSKEVHLAQLASGLREMESWGLPVRWVGLWVNQDWQVEVAK